MSLSPPPPQSSRRSGGPFRALLLYTRGLILNQQLRRVTMFWTVLAAMLMAFTGWEVFSDWLEPHRHFYRFAVFWLLCGWLTILAALLAVYDLLMVRLTARAAQRALRAKMLGREALGLDREK